MKVTVLDGYSWRDLVAFITARDADVWPPHKEALALFTSGDVPGLFINQTVSRFQVAVTEVDSKYSHTE